MHANVLCFETISRSNVQSLLYQPKSYPWCFNQAHFVKHFSFTLKWCRVNVKHTKVCCLYRTEVVHCILKEQDTVKNEGLKF